MKDFPKSEIEYDERFSNPDACYDYLFKKKWPNGFKCIKCANSKYWVSSRKLYICTQCEHNHSLKAGTNMDSLKKPITYWFKAMWWFTTNLLFFGTATSLQPALIGVDAVLPFNLAEYFTTRATDHRSSKGGHRRLFQFFLNADFKPVVMVPWVFIEL